MARRKGMMVGKGKKGYHNVVPKDKVVHSQSARGIKQPQRVRKIPILYKIKWKNKDGDFKINTIKEEIVDEFQVGIFATGGQIINVERK